MKTEKSCSIFEMLACVYTRLDPTGTITKLVGIGLAFTQDLADRFYQKGILGNFSSLDFCSYRVALCRAKFDPTQLELNHTDLV